MQFEGMTISVSLGGTILSAPRLRANTLGPNFCHVDNGLPLDGLPKNSVHVFNRSIQPPKNKTKGMLLKHVSARHWNEEINMSFYKPLFFNLLFTLRNGYEALCVKCRGPSRNLRHFTLHFC